MKAILYSAAILIGLAVLTHSAEAITWCHDYTYYRVSNNNVDRNKTGVDQLRQLLWAKGYRPQPGSNKWTGQNLKAGDVVIFGDAHSGYVRSKVNGQGLITHFLMVDPRQRPSYTPAKLIGLLGPRGKWSGGLFRNDTLEKVQSRFHNHRRQPIEVWRKGGLNELYYLFLVGKQEEVIVARKSVLLNKRCRDLSKWGLGSTLVKDVPGMKIVPKSQGFPTAEMAKRYYLSQKISERTLPLAAGKVAKFKFDGQEHPINNALGLLPSR
jgi:hypothetical protein